MLTKHLLLVNVLEAAKARIAEVFCYFDRVLISFSGGKDSTVLLHLVMEEVIRRKISKDRVGLLFIDWEAQFQLTIEHVKRCYDMYTDYCTPLWVCLPFSTTNAVSVIEPEWVCWDPAKRDLWVRDLPQGAITDPSYFPFYEQAMTFEDFVPAMGSWFSMGGPTACFVGIRTAESLNRFRSMFSETKTTFNSWQWTTRVDANVFNVYPIYDWAVEDVWTYAIRSGKCYNRLYDRMHQAGLTLHQMRVCEPYGDEQRRGLWLFHVIEPQTWAKVVARVAGANSGSLYCGESGNVLGNITVTLPSGHTWETFARFLLDTMPMPTAEHYRNKIAVYLQWCKTHSVEVPLEAPGDTGSTDVPSWRRICKVLLKNDYWCKGLSFSPTKNSAYQKYQELMKRRRDSWGVI